MIKLFEPCDFAGMPLHNRIIVAPMCQYSAFNGIANSWHINHYASLAKYNPGLVMIEATAVSAVGRISDRCLGLWNDDQERALGQVMDAVRMISDTRFGLQLGHAGRHASMNMRSGGPPVRLELDRGGWQPIAPSSLAPHDRGCHVPRAMDDQDRACVIAEFRAAAVRADRIGVDLLELHFGQGYLVSSYLSSLANQRDDSYGGAPENRFRFALEVFRAVRAVWPLRKPLGVRINATDWDPEGIGISDAIGIMLMLAETGCTFVDVTSGGNSAAVTNTYDGYQIDLSRQLRCATGLPTIAAGGLSDPALANFAVAAGYADAAAIGRGFLFNANWTGYAARKLGFGGHRLPRQYRPALPSYAPNMPSEDADTES